MPLHFWTFTPFSAFKTPILVAKLSENSLSWLYNIY